MAIVVSDTSPVRALHHLGLLGLLRSLYGEVVVPPAVASELAFPRARFVPVDVEHMAGFRVVTPRDSTAVKSLGEVLHNAEAEAIVVAKELRADLLLVDERAARQIAQDAGLKIIGAVGILARAKEHGLVTRVEPLLDSLATGLGFFISAALREEVLREVGEWPSAT